MSLRILFVDDDQDVINGYRRIYYKFKSEWDMFFALSGRQAIEIINKEKINVIVSDMRMPGMDGDELLKEIQKTHPQILRIILSGHQDEIKIIRSLSSAHQFLIKPCTPEDLKAAIVNAYALRNLLEDKKVINLINGLGKVPSLPDIYIKLENELNKPDVSFQNIEEIILKDPAITAKILQVVNSGFFGIPRKISNLMDALNLLGTNLVKSIILYLETFSDNHFDDKAAKFINEIGKHSLRVAEITRIICKKEHIPKTISDDIFICGILHDIGKLILINFENYIEAIDHKSNSSLSISQAETELFGYNHSGVGAYLLGIWGLHKDIIQAVAFHHNPDDLIYHKDCMIDILHIANGLAYYKFKDFDIDKIDFDKEYVLSKYSEGKIRKWWLDINLES
ncbi:MAG: HDOD domain-containing protein [Candidatus Kapabacteria bacterium]|nr:HDOD domain-containing protein [Ignavibacteriota bacterium]MCW5884671.1 HDOD domain-containing protein [Candidatus Kapabacteria bacterium]